MDRSARDAIQALPMQDPHVRQVTDSYLWIPGCAINVKLRSWQGGESLKLKRLCRDDREHQVQLWVERQEEDYALPVSPGVITALASELGIELAAPEMKVDRAALVRLLGEASDQVEIVKVQKARWVYRWGAAGSDVLVELAEIASPERTTSVGLEDQMGLSERSPQSHIDAARDAVARVRSELRLTSSLATFSYLDALAVWARGGSLT